jgi:hypothetical protein
MRMMLVLKIMAAVLLLAGFGTVLGARSIVKSFGMDQKVEVTFENEMNEEEIAKYKLSKAILNVKTAGMLIALPGIILTLIAFK